MAEFLAAKALAKRLEAGLPLGRLLSLMQGFDGKPVEPLRGLFAWLVVYHPRARARLIPLDPLGVVLNGDVAALSTFERVALLDALSEAARQDKRFRRDAWMSHPFGPLASADMASTFALCHGEPMPALATALETWVEDREAWFGNRLGVKPVNALHLRELLVERIPQAQRHRLAVQVLDLSLPALG